MKKIYTTLMLWLATLGSALAQQLPSTAFTELKSISEKVEFREGINTPARIQLKNNTGTSPSELVSSYLNSELPAGNLLKEQKVEVDKVGFSHFSYKQLYKGIPVEGGEYKISYGANGISYAAGFIYTVSTLPSAALSEAQGLDAAMKKIGAQSYMWQAPKEEAAVKQLRQDPSATYFPKAVQVILPIVDAAGNYSYRLAYKYDVYAKEPMSRNWVYVDAVDGEVLKMHSRLYHAHHPGTGNTMYNGTQSFTTQHNGSNYILREDTLIDGGRRNIITLDINQGTNFSAAVDFVDADNNWVHTTNQDDAGWSAHWAAEKTWDYYYYVLGRNSIDNNGAAINQFVHYRSGEDNAYWDGERMLYGDGTVYNPLVSVDVCGHEVSHGVTERSSGLIYENESGALNESFSDIFGTAVEVYAENGVNKDYLIGEDFDPDGSGIRDMSNPKSFSHPDTYGGQYWQASTSFPNIANDYGGVHINSGVQNYWFYLLAEGGSGTNDNNDSYNVIGIGVDKAAQIASRNNTTKLSSNSNFADARAGAIASARELFGIGSQEEISVVRAWYAVGVGSDYVGSPVACPRPRILAFSSITGSSVTISWSNVSQAQDFTLAYRILGSSSWSTVQAISTPFTLSGLTDATVYEVKVKANCGSSTSVYSDIRKVFITSNGNPQYCSSFGEEDVNYINSVTIGAFTNQSGRNGGYLNGTDRVIEVSQGDQLGISLNQGAAYFQLNAYWRIWVDFNVDGDFDDANELVYVSPDQSGTITGSINIPQNATPTETRIRIQMSLDELVTACDTFQTGEVEDYTISIEYTGGSSCAVPNNLQSSNVDTSSADLSWDAVSGAVGYILNYREQGQAWTQVSVSSNSYALSGLSPNTSYDWKVRTDCGSGSESADSGEESFTTLDNNPPATCNTPQNLQSSNITENSASLSWSAVSGAQSYVLRYRISTQNWDSLTVSSNNHNLNNLNDDTNYEWTVRTNCGGGNESANAAVQSFTTQESAPPAGYCSSAGASSSSEWIAQVTLGSLNNTSGNNSGYADFTASVINAERGSSISISLRPGFTSNFLYTNTYPEYWRVWIDYNQDNDFDDAGELAFDAGSTSSATVNGSINIPANASLGSTRVRVQMKYNAASAACESFARGEVEDYTINLSDPAPPVCNSPSNLQSSSVTQNSAVLTWSSVAAAQNYVLNYREQGASWTSVNVSASSYNLSGLNSATVYEWKVRSNCGSGNESADAAVQSFTTQSTNPPATYCASKGDNAGTEWIGEVTLGSLYNNSNADGGYGDYTNLVVNAQRGQQISVSLVPYFYLFGYQEYWRIWIDYNQDNDFDDAGELAFDAGSTSSGTVNGSFTIPASALTGNTRLRVQMKFNGAPSACETFPRGEVEDYTINISAASLTTGIAGVESQESVSIYPNPATDRLYIEQSIGARDYQIISASGKLVMSGSVDEASQLNISALSPGVYFVRLNTQNTSSSHRIVIR